MQVPAALAKGAVRTSHLIFLFIVIFCAAVIAAIKLTSFVDPAIRQAAGNMVVQALMAGAILVLTLVVPELRRSVPALYGPRRHELSLTDAGLFMALMLAWALGASRLVVTFPALHWWPDLFGWFGLAEQPRSVTSIFIFLWLAATSVIAPIAEELFFRGYLQNVIHARWGLWPGVLISSIFFGAVHMQDAVFATVAGVYFALIYLHYGSLWPGTLLHGLYNLTINGSGLKQYFFVKEKSEVTMISSWIPEILLTLAFVPLLYLFWRRFKPTS